MGFVLWLLWFAEPASGEGTAKLVLAVADSGRVVEMAEPPGERVTPPLRLAPGAPPLLALRYLDGKARHRFGDMDLVLDDANH